MPKVDAELGPILNSAATGDLSQFHARGGKLIIFQGWADPIVSPYQTIALYKALSEKFGLARWVEDGVAPSHVVATSYVGNDASKGIAILANAKLGSDLSISRSGKRTGFIRPCQPRLSIARQRGRTGGMR